MTVTRRDLLHTLPALAVAPITVLVVGCSGSIGDDEQNFAAALVEVGLDGPVDVDDPDVAQAGQFTCEQLKDGKPLTLIYSAISRDWYLSEDQAREFTAAAVYAFCPNAI